MKTSQINNLVKLAKSNKYIPDFALIHLSNGYAIAKDIMNNDPIYVTPESLIYNMMIKISRYKFKINIVPVIEEDKFLGYVNLN